MNRYQIEGNTIIRNSKEGPEQLTNFSAQIVTQLIYHDGPKTTTQLIIKGRLHNEKELPAVVIPATEFASMNWVADKWGMEPIIFPVASAERDIRTAVQMSSTPEQKHIYTHTGWTDIGGVPRYLTTTGALGPDGLDSSIDVQLPQELARYALPKPVGNPEDFIQSMRTINIGPRAAMWTMFLATYRAALGQADFAVHLAGRTGTFKSEITSLYQSHFGGGMDARHLPASWNSTANALEHLAYRAMHALFVIDDFVPVGTPYQVRQLQKNADQIIRAQGNQSGRSRLTDVSSMQQTYFPRGVILSTGEDIPEGHSVRGRMMIVEVGPGQVQPEKLRTSQDARESYPRAMADFIQWTTTNNSRDFVRTQAKKHRDENLGIGHTRTPSILGELLATLDIISEFALEKAKLSVDQVCDFGNKARAALKEAAMLQADYLETADPCTVLLETIREILSSQKAHVATKTGGIPKDAEKWGWTSQEADGQITQYRHNGPRLAWIDPNAGEFLLDPAMIALIKKHSDGKLGTTVQTLTKRLREAGLIVRTDDARQRLSVRCTLDGSYRSVIAMPLSEILED
jgi:uncharacterized protein DUF927